MTDNEHGHDFDDPQSHLNAIEAVWLAADSTVHWCDHCTVTHKMLPMTGVGWGLEVFHEPHCPNNDDNLPTPQRPDRPAFP